MEIIANTFKYEGHIEDDKKYKDDAHLYLTERYLESASWTRHLQLEFVRNSETLCFKLLLCGTVWAREAKSTKDKTQTKKTQYIAI